MAGREQVVNIRITDGPQFSALIDAVACVVADYQHRLTVDPEDVDPNLGELAHCAAALDIETP